MRSRVCTMSEEIMKVATQVATTNVAIIALIAFSIHTLGFWGLFTMFALLVLQVSSSTYQTDSTDTTTDENQSTLDEYGGTDGKGIQAPEVKT